MTRRNGALRTLRVLSLSALAVLAACGGGGSSTTANASASTEPLGVTADNANTVARAGLAGLDVGQVAVGLGSVFVGPTGQFNTVAQARRMHAMAVNAVGATNRILATRQAVIDCPNGGTMTIAVNDSNNSGSMDAVGESATVSFNACHIDSSSLATGSLSLTLTRYSSASDLAVNLVFTNFTATGATPGTSVAMNGNLALSLVSATDVTVSSDSFTAAATVQGVTHAFSMQAYSAHVVDGGTQVTETLAGTFSSSDFADKSVTVSTPTPVVILAADNYPSQGVLLIQGANQSAVKIEAYSATQARVSVDANGDGTYETSTLVNWADLG